jgi:hypothetical protein
LTGVGVAELEDLVEEDPEDDAELEADLLADELALLDADFDVL